MSVDRVFKFAKDPKETYDLVVDFLNADDGVEYEIDSVEVYAYDKAGTNVTSTILDAGNTTFNGNRAVALIKTGGTPKAVYKIEVLAIMTTGQKIMKRNEMTVSD